MVQHGSWQDSAFREIITNESQLKFLEVIFFIGFLVVDFTYMLSLVGTI